MQAVVKLTATCVVLLQRDEIIRLIRHIDLPINTGRAEILPPSEEPGNDNKNN